MENSIWLILHQEEYGTTDRRGWDTELVFEDDTVVYYTTKRDAEVKADEMNRRELQGSYNWYKADIARRNAVKDASEEKVLAEHVLREKQNAALRDAGLPEFASLVEVKLRREEPLSFEEWYKKRMLIQRDKYVVVEVKHGD